MLITCVIFFCRWNQEWFWKFCAVLQNSLWLILWVSIYLNSVPFQIGQILPKYFLLKDHIMIPYGQQQAMQLQQATSVWQRHCYLYYKTAQFYERKNIFPKYHSWFLLKCDIMPVGIIEEHSERRYDVIIFSKTV